MTEPTFGALNPDGTVRIVTLDEWIEAFQNTDRVIARTQVGTNLVSTVFLGMDPNYWSGSDPAWFETMVFDAGAPADYQHRAATREAALENHRRAIGALLLSKPKWAHQLTNRPQPQEHSALEAIRNRLARAGACSCDSSDGYTCEHHS